MPYVEVVEGHKYILVPVVQQVIDNVDILIGAHIYTLSGRYMGYWSKGNMLGTISDRLQHYVESTATSNLPKKVIIKTAEQLERLRRYE